MSWRGEAGGIEAAKQNHEVIMTPGSTGLYLDQKQSTSADEPLTIGGLSNHAKVYAYDPVPKELNVDQRKYIIGVQGNMWGEYLKTPAKVEYMLLPRLFSLAEIAWTPVDRKDFKNFNEDRLPLHLAKLDKTTTNYWVPTPIGQPQSINGTENVTLTLKSPMPGAKIFYTLDGYRPSENATAYVEPIKVVIPQAQKKVLKTIVIMPSGKRSVVTETILNNEATTKK